MSNEDSKPAAEPVEDEAKRKFREALERKNGVSGQGASHADGQSKVHDAHGPAKTSRTFRRKSGG